MLTTITAAELETLILTTVARNPGVTLASIQSEIRSTYSVSSRAVIAALVDRGVIEIRNGFNVYPKG